MTLKCGCRPAAHFCADAEELQFALRLAIASRSLVSTPQDLANSYAEIGAAERALRDHLRGEVAA